MELLDQVRNEIRKKQYSIRTDLGDLGPMERAKKPGCLPVVMSRDEARRVLLNMTGEAKLMAQLFYGCGLRLMECVRIRGAKSCAGTIFMKPPDRKPCAAPPPARPA